MSALFFVALLLGQEPNPTFQVETNQVLIDVQAYRKTSGAYIRDLTKRDFEILDDGIPQEITYLDFSAAALDVALLLDVSGSMAETTRTVTLGAYAALDSLRPEDRVAVVVFASRPRVAVEFTSDRNRIVDVVEWAPSNVSRVDSATRVYDATGCALGLFGYRRAGAPCRALLAVTDDQERSSKANLKTLVRIALEKDITVNGLIFVGDR